jgi:hypothetical protein
MTTRTIASGPGWTLRRDDNEPAVLDIADPCYETMEFPGHREMGVQLPEDLVARIAGHAGITGEVVYVGDYRPDYAMVPDETPCIIIACTREALKSGPPMVYCAVTVARVPTPKHAETETGHDA